jgi:exopolysaccharide biosynthesis protein
MTGYGKTRKYLVLLAAVGLTVGIGALLANLAHGDAGDGPWVATSSTTQVDSTDSSAASTAGSDSTEAMAASSPTTGGAVDDPAAEYTATATSYTSATTSITITQVTVGSGSNTVTYFVADVTLASATNLQAAFAGGEFGEGRSEDTSDIAAARGAILAINGDAAEDRSDGIIIRNGVVYRDVPTRMGLALYADGRVEVYNETEVSAEELLADGVWNTYSFGPALLVDGTIGDNLDTVEVEAHPQHPIQGSQPRTGIGVIAENHLVFIVVDGRSPGYSRGVTLEEFAAIFQDLGCTTAYNLDGGGSSSMYFMGELVNNPLGRNEERGVGDILLVK